MRPESELKRVEAAMANHRIIIAGIILIAALYTCGCIIIFQMVSGIPNAIDNDDGLPRMYDLFMFASVIVVNLMAYASVRSILNWIPKRIRKRQSTKSIWDTIPSGNPRRTSMPGPPASILAIRKKKDTD